jgi:S-formylglutathione hydrolase FrmB
LPGSKDSWDFGEGAGFYLNATQPGWEKWRMYEYITTELPQVLLQFPELDTKKVKTPKRAIPNSMDTPAWTLV